MTINPIVAVVAQIQSYKEGSACGSGTGFWYAVNDKLFLVTNRHVIIKESEDHFPDEIQLLLHLDPEDIRRNDTYAIPLYRDQKPAWLEHPAGGRHVDVIAIPVDRESIQARFFIRALDPSAHLPKDVEVTIGADLQVIGYPLGFHDVTHNLPLVRNATLASVYPIPFEGNPFVLVDARLHSGTSGSPVMTKPSTSIAYVDGRVSQFYKPISHLVGIHSATIDALDRDADKDEPLGLNIVWFADLLPQIITQSR